MLKERKNAETTWAIRWSLNCKKSTIQYAKTSHLAPPIFYLERISCLFIIIYEKLQAIHLMLHKRWCKTAKIKKYKHELMY